MKIKKDAANASIQEKSNVYLHRARGREPSNALFGRLARLLLLLFVMVITPLLAQAHTILGVTDCNCTNITIQLTNFPSGILTADLGGATVDGTYDFANQVIVLTRPS